MGVLSTFRSPRSRAQVGGYDPITDFWRGTEGYLLAGSGARVNAESAMTLSAVWKAVRLLSETIGSLPLHLYQRTNDGGKQEAENHPLYRVIHRMPNQR